MTQNDCIFCRIIEGSIPSKKVYEDECCLAFHDIRPQAPTHLMIIPKKHIPTINDITEDDKPLLGHLVLIAKKLAKEMNIDESGYRLIYNINQAGGQEVFHIHLHLLGGRQMAWPPG